MDTENIKEKKKWLFFGYNDELTNEEWYIVKHSTKVFPINSVSIRKLKQFSNSDAKSKTDWWYFTA